MVDFSIGEIESLVLKAYRGAGFSWGMAQEAGSAAAWLALNNLPALDAFATLLQQIDGVSHSALTPQAGGDGLYGAAGGKICPVIAGSALADGFLDDAGLKSGVRVQLQRVVCPVILLPFVAAYEDISIGWLQLSLQSRNIILSTSTAAEVETTAPVDVTITPLKSPGPLVNGDCRRGSGMNVSLLYLESLAHRTYVPATEQSRLAGAGAGLTDND